MTDPATMPADSAANAAAAAARTAGIRLRELSALSDFEAVHRLYDEIWRPDPANPPVTAELLRALTKAGNYVAGAYEGGTMVGACVGFFGAPADRVMHSHIAGVAAGAAGRAVGFAMKLHQRAWAMSRNVAAIAWTFDPLVRRNAYFNLGKLGAEVSEYLPNFYGPMNDGINGTDDTDRLLVHWQLDAPSVVEACAGTPRSCSADAALERGARIGLGRSMHERPVAGALDGDTVLVAVPTDIETLRSADPSSASQWRTAVRDTLGTLLADGATVVGFDRSGWYVVTRGDNSEETR